MGCCSCLRVQQRPLPDTAPSLSGHRLLDSRDLALIPSLSFFACEAACPVSASESFWGLRRIHNHNNSSCHFSHKSHGAQGQANCASPGLPPGWQRGASHDRQGAQLMEGLDTVSVPPKVGSID